MNASPNKSPVRSLPWLALTAVLMLALVTGCRIFDPGSHTRQATSLMQYLYPGQAGQTATPTIPTLTLPLRVGVAFVPEGRNARELAGVWAEQRLPEAFKVGLMRQVSEQFRSLPFVRSIELIPTAYLTPGGGFANVEQLKQMFGVDVVVLLSFDQSQSTYAGLLTCTYWTIVGAYVVPAEKNTTTTLLDAAVFDVASHSLLFRAPGLSLVKGLATPVNLAEERRLDAEAGFRNAATNLVTNLNGELATFQQRIKERPEEVKIVRSPGYHAGGGALSLGEAAAALALCLAVWRNRSESR